ncbi:MAG: hypothetical protein ACTSYL_04995 [Candidatus Thorarchaeota archaeon]
MLKYNIQDLAYAETHTGRSVKAKPERYYLFACPNCGRIAHKRCWYNVAEQRVKKGLFGTKGYRLVCPSCGYEVAPLRKKRTPWTKGYQIPGHPDSELLEIFVADIRSYKTGKMFGSLGRAITGLFRAVGLGSLTDPERSAIARAAAKVGRTMEDVAKDVFKIELPKEGDHEIKALTCQNCGAPLPMPGPGESVVVCEHCGTAHIIE